MINLVSREDALQEAASKLDISPSKYKQAIDRFNAMKSFLLDGEYEGTTSPTDVYLQGSFKLGTEIRPFIDSKDSDYDIDLVCRLGHIKQYSQASSIKKQVGDRIKSNGTYSRMLDDEGKRCWTLIYAEEDKIGFHMDVLPAVNEQNGVGQIHSISATNKHQDESYTWTTSNPKGFAEWFYQRNGEAFQLAKLSQKQQIFNNQRQLFNSVDDVPNIHVKTPLQRTIQILKRHRDIRFSQSDIELCKPISMIITVLAGSCYRNENTIFDTLNNLITLMDQQAAQLNTDFVFNDNFSRATYNLITRKADGSWLILNPANPGENFADRWHEDDHARAKAFFQWVSWLKEDFININSFVERDRFTKALVDVYRPSNLPALHFNVQHKQHGGWPLSLNQQYSVEIKGSYKTNVFWKKFESGQPLLKGKDLKFKVDTNIPKPFDIYWQVVNTGREAANAGQLRGEISEHTNTTSSDIYRTESTSYTGDHWVECYVIKNGNCVAKSGEFIVSIRDRF